MIKNKRSVPFLSLNDRIAARFAKLHAKAASFEGGGGRSTAEAWQREDPQTIAAALGAYTADGPPKRRLCALLLRLRYWPESVRPDQRTAVTGITSGLLAQQVEAVQEAIPDRVLPRIVRISTDGSLSRVLLAELSAATPCDTCLGRGWSIRLFDDRGIQLEAPVRVDCPACRGLCSVPWSLARRAQLAHMRHYPFRHYVAPIYGRTLHGLAAMADRAARGVLTYLG